jgi:hypothetical protein
MVSVDDQKQFRWSQPVFKDKQEEGILTIIFN